MYFVHEGRVVALSEDTLYEEKVDRWLESGEMFGYEQGISRFVGQEFTYKAVKYSVIVMLKRDDWIHLLDFFPASKEVVLGTEKGRNRKKLNRN